MAQTFVIPTTDTAHSTAIATNLANNDLALVSGHSGATEPTTTYAYMVWNDTTTGLRKVRNAADAAWITVGALDQNHSIRSYCGHELGTISASQDFYLGAVSEDATAARVGIITSTSTSSADASNEITVQLRNLTQSLDLFSATVGSFTTLAGVRTDSEFLLDAVSWFIPDQNTSLNADDVLELQLTWVGSPASGTLTRLGLQLETIGR
jgi:hypothetical protein